VSFTASKELPAMLPSFSVLGVRVHAVQMDDAIATIEQWIASDRQTHFVSAATVHVVMESRRDRTYREAMLGADLCLPDGTPLLWIGRKRGYQLASRVYGPDLMFEFCRRTADKGYRHFFYGGAPGVPQQLASELKRRFPELVVAGAYSPPFRTLTIDEDAEVVRMINQAAPDLLWVGLGAPKQEKWIHYHRHSIQVPAMLAVGQAFDIHSGRVKQAPAWMSNYGLEWLYRLAKEPRRLWRRYLIYNAQFVCLVAAESLRHLSRPPSGPMADPPGKPYG